MQFIYTENDMIALGEKDENLKIAMAYIGKIDRKRMENLDEALFSLIISQQISKVAAKTIEKKVVDLTDFKPATIMEISTTTLQACGLSFRKVEYLKAAAGFLLEAGEALGTLDLWTDQEIMNRFTTIKGVGPWTVEMIMIFTLNRMDVLSVGDGAIKRGIKRLYGLEVLTKEKEQALKARFSPFGSVASLYFWEISHLPKEALAEMIDIVESK